MEFTEQIPMQADNDTEEDGVEPHGNDLSMPVDELVAKYDLDT